MSTIQFKPTRLHGVKRWPERRLNFPRMDYFQAAGDYLDAKKKQRKADADASFIRKWDFWISFLVIALSAAFLIAWALTGFYGVR